MKIASATQFKISLPWGQRTFSIVSSVLNVKALVGAISVVVKTGCGTDGSFYSTSSYHFTSVAPEPLQHSGVSPGGGVVVARFE